MDIKVLKAEDFQKSIDLISYAFCIDFTEQLTAFWKSDFHELLTLAVVEEDDILAQLTILDLKTYINGKAISSGGITRVSSWPQNRRKGYVKQLMIRSLEEMRQKKQLLSYLAPFDFGFYEKFGWVNYSEYKKYTFTDKKFPRYESVEGRIKLSKNYEDVVTVYDQFIKKYNGSLIRDAKWYETHTLPRKKGHTAIYYNEQNEPEGYILYKIHNLATNPHPKDFPIERQITVFEFAHITEDARKGLYNFIATHDAAVQTLVVTVPKDDFLSYTLPSLTFQQEIVPFLMLRIVDVGQFIQAYRFIGSAVLEFKLAVKDAYAPWNDGVFHIVIREDGKAEVHKVEGGTFDVSISIQDLSAIFVGAKSIKALRYAQRVEGNNEVILQLEKQIQQSETFIVDFF